MKQRLYLVQVNGRYGQNVYLPYAVGLLWAYARTFPEIVAAYDMAGFLYEKEPIADAVARLEAPDVVAISCYTWNWEWSKAFARAVKEKWPACAIIVGGVQVQDESPEILADNPQFDFAIYGEGEGAFADFLLAHCYHVRSYPVGSLIWRHRHGGQIVVNERRAFVPLEELRSPYLDGVFDGLLPREPRWQVLQETARGCPYSSFAGDTYAALPDRIIRFDEESYAQSTSLPCHDPRHAHHAGTIDARLVSQGPRECVRLTFSNGLALVVTPKHPMFAVRDEAIVDVKADELAVGDWIPVEVGQNSVTENLPLSPITPTEADRMAAAGIGQGRRVPDEVQLPDRLDERVGWLSGYLVGDGCLPSDGRASVLFAVKPRSEAMLKQFVTDLFGLDLHVHDSAATDKMQHGAVHSRRVVQFFRESMGIGSGESKLQVPRGIFRSPTTVVRAFLGGLWCADGYWPENGEPYLTTVSERLANECAALIHWIGDAAVVRKITVIERLGSFRNSSPIAYRVEWHGEACRSRVHGKPCLASRVPAVRHTYRSKSGELRLRHTANHANREGSPREVLRLFEPNHPLLERRFVYVRVTECAPAGVRPVFDVHNHPDHTISANGAYVRQCSFCAWGQAALAELRLFPEERVLAELEWFGAHGVDYLDNADANYGIVKRDVDLTRALAATKAKYGYPRTFRTSFAKNSNETIWEIANVLHDAGMLKSVTLAMQSMDAGVLVNIRRKNIKFDKFETLLERYEAAGIPTYTELILGLPGETLDRFVDGIEQNLAAGQHSGLFVYINLLLNNTEQKKPEYMAAHGLRALPLKAMLSHGTPDPSAIREVQPVIVATSAMTHDEWKRGWLYSKAIEIFHSQGLLQEIAVALHERRGMSYRSFYGALIDWLRRHPGTVGARELATAKDVLERALAGGVWDCVDSRLGTISWPPEEFAFARICLELERFYDEIHPFLQAMGASDEEMARQRRAVVGPTPGDEERWAREVVWYGRRGYAKTKRRAS